MKVLPYNAHRSKPGETVRSRSFLYRVARTCGGLTTVLLKTPDLEAARACFEQHADEERKAGSQAKVYLDKFTLEEREVWATRFNWSMPPKPPSEPADSRSLRILFVPFEIPTWTNARGWDYAANLAYGDALRKMGHRVTVLNTLTIQFRELLKDQKFDQVWTHVHFRHATDHYYREWLADAAPVRLGLCGESVFRNEPDEYVANPWYEEQTRAFHDWRPFLTHVAAVAPTDVARIRKDWPRLPVMPWKQAVPAEMVLPVREKPQTSFGVFVGAAYPPRDTWIWHPALRKLLAKPNAPESARLGRAWDRSHPLVNWWVRGVGAFPEQALAHYHRRLSSLRKKSLRAFIETIGQGVGVVNLPSMVQAYGSRVVEGVASGRPVLSWAPPGEDMFVPGEEILHYGDSPEELAELILRVQRDPELANRVARAARKRVLADHTTEKRVEQLLAFTQGTTP